MNRRGFFGRLAGAVVASRAAPAVAQGQRLATLRAEELRALGDQWAAEMDWPDGERIRQRLAYNHTHYVCGQHDHSHPHVHGRPCTLTCGCICDAPEHRGRRERPLLPIALRSSEL